MKRILSCIVCIMLLSINIEIIAKEPILKKVNELEKIAKLSNGGGLGCGSANFEIKAGRKRIKVGLGEMNTVHVFGEEIDLKDLKTILKSRVDSYKNASSPLKGDYEALCHICLHTIKYSLDESVIPILVSLMQDSSNMIRAGSIRTLLYMAEQDPKLRKKIKYVKFPLSAIESGKGWGIVIPEWVQVEQ